MGLALGVFICAGESLGRQATCDDIITPVRSEHTYVSVLSSKRTYGKYDSHKWKSFGIFDNFWEYERAWQGAQSFNLSTWEAEGLVQASQSYRDIPTQKKEKKKEKNLRK